MLYWAITRYCFVGMCTRRRRRRPRNFSVRNKVCFGCSARRIASCRCRHCGVEVYTTHRYNHTAPCITSIDVISVILYCVMWHFRREGDPTQELCEFWGYRATDVYRETFSTNSVKTVGVTCQFSDLIAFKHAVEHGLHSKFRPTASRTV